MEIKHRSRSHEVIHPQNGHCGFRLQDKEPLSDGLVDRLEIDLESDPPKRSRKGAICQLKAWYDPVMSDVALPVTTMNRSKLRGADDTV